MGIIQNALNQTLGAAAIATRLDPKFETRTKEQNLKQQLATFEKKSSTELGDENYTEKRTELLEEIAATNPTKKNVNAALASIEELGKERQSLNRMGEAQRKAAEAQEAVRVQQEQSRAFREMFTQGGIFK